MRREYGTTRESETRSYCSGEIGPDSDAVGKVKAGKAVASYNAAATATHMLPGVAFGP